MDITLVRVHNGDRRIRVVVEVSRITAGDFGVRFQAKGVHRERRAVVYSEYDGEHTPTVLFGTDEVHQCTGLAVEWDKKTDWLVASLPSRCWRHGNLGAVRAHAITEVGGVDTDFAPKRPDGTWGWTAWVARG